MQIVLRKFAHKPTVMTCIRDDGSGTWQSYGNQSDFFAVHDLTHFAVETELGYLHTFFGMLAAGRDVSDFGSGDAATFHPEAIYAEFLAGLLTTTDGIGSNLSYQQIKDEIDQKMAEIGVDPISLTEEQFNTILSLKNDLAQEWMALPTGATMTLQFPFAPDPVRS